MNYKSRAYCPWNGTRITSDLDQSEVFVGLFKNVFRKDSGTAAPKCKDLDPQLESISLNKEEVLMEQNKRY